MNYIKPGEPNQNDYIQRFNRTYRTKILDAHLFGSIEHAREVTEHWLVCCRRPRFDHQSSQVPVEE